MNARKARQSPPADGKDGGAYLSIRSIASATGYSRSTIHRVLQNHPNIAPDLRRAVLEQVQRLGYRPNPYVSSLMSQVRTGRVQNVQAGLGYLTLEKNRPGRNAGVRPPRVFHAAGERATQRGYNLQTFGLERLDEAHWKKTRRMLVGRGIRGLLLDGQMMLGDRMPESAWHSIFSEFGCIVLGISEVHPVLQIDTDPFYNPLRVFFELHRAGYRRPGLLVSSVPLAMSGYQMLAAHELFRTMTQDPGKRIPACIYDLEFHAVRARLGLASGQPVPLSPYLEKLDWKKLAKNAADDEHTFSKVHAAILKRWVGTFRPDVIVTSDGRTVDWAEQAGLSVPGKIGVAHLNVDRDVSDWAGLRPDHEAIGATAVDELCDQVESNRFGPAMHRRRILVPGLWQTGKTIRRTAPETSHAEHNVFSRWIANFTAEQTSKPAEGG